MKIQSHFLILLTLVLPLKGFNQKALKMQLDSLLDAKRLNPYSGVVLVSQSDKIKYSKTFGFADQNHTVKVKPDDKFVIGSISKQITAVLVLQQYEKGSLKLSDPVSKYLSFIPQSWDTITIDQLLSHTHGFVRIEKPLAFKPGTKFMYSQHGYELLAQILEKVTNTSFAEQSKQLFKKCGMKNSCHPNYLKKGELLTCFTRNPDGSTVVETKSLESFPAAGAFVSTAGDLALWNTCLFGGKLISDSTLRLMVTPKQNAVRDHPVFGTTLYGYGITSSNDNGVEQWGQTGFADGFACMNFYFHQEKVSVIALENIVYNPDNMKTTFSDHVQVLNIVKRNLLTQKK